MHGTAESYDQQGRRLQRTSYQQGLRHGTSEYYEGERIQMRQQCEHGLPHGPTVIYDPAGHVAAELNFAKGQLHGDACYYAQGRLLRRAHFKQGKLDGIVEDLGPDGTLVQRVGYRDDLMHGPALRYWPNGQVMERTDFEHGSAMNAAARFDQNGRAIGDAGPKLVERVEKLFRGMS